MRTMLTYKDVVQRLVESRMFGDLVEAFEAYFWNRLTIARHPRHH
jgi:hypothetical protein